MGTEPMAMRRADRAAYRTTPTILFAPTSHRPLSRRLMAGDREPPPLANSRKTGADKNDDDEERRRASLKEALLFVPNVAKLAARLARDPRTPRSVKWSLLAFGIYLACPIDLIPDWLPVIGYLDDIVLIALAGRWIARRISPDLIAEHWDGQAPFPEAVARLSEVVKRPRRHRGTENPSTPED